jgi:hypothetical protein
MTPKEYRKTWYWRISTRNYNPTNWVRVSPIRIFGIHTGLFLWKIAKANYPWTNLNSK